MLCNEWRISARKMLHDGYGVEDVALRLSISVEDVRRFVAALRASGRLSDVLFGRRYRGD